MGNASTVIAGIGAALIGAVTAVAGYAWQPRAARCDKRAQEHAEPNGCWPGRGRPRPA